MCIRDSFRTKWRLHPSSRLATINMGQKLGGGGCALCSGGSWVSIEHKVAWAEAYLHTKCQCHLSPSSRLATTDIGRKLGGLCPFREGSWVPINTQCRVNRGLPPYTKWRLHPSSRLATIDMAENWLGGGCALFSGGSSVPMEHKVAWAEAYLHTKWDLRLSPSSSLI